MTDISALAQMLNPKEEGDSDSDTDCVKYTPADLGNRKPKSKIPDVTPSTVKKAPAGKDIWDAEFVPEGVSTDHEETRPQPEYDVCFKQNIGTEDMFLGMSGKHPGSNDELIITISLPKTKSSDIDLNVTDERVDCWTSEYALRLHLPKPVVSNQGAAQWITDKEQLRLTLPLKKEFDFLP
ncbi:hypothetical protein ACHWQZ_G009773 [Mnemiopsis leidyi]